MKWTFNILCTLFFICSLQAQITPQLTGTSPELVCVKNSASNQISIQWNTSPNIGSCFQQYDIYLSKNSKEGPYAKIDSSLSPSSGTLTFDPNFNGIVYVFMVNKQSCVNPSQTEILTSDTLDNIVPQAAPEIIKVSVVNNIPVLYWKPSVNPEVTGYAIYTSTNNYNEPIDTVDGRLSNSFQDVLHSASDSIAVYKIRSIEYCEDPNGLFSNITPAYNTVLATHSDEDLCKRSVQVYWNGYNNQNREVLGYRIDYSEDGGNQYTVKATLPDTVRSYDFVGLTAQTTTCIRVVALLPDNDSSLSNVTCIFSQGVAPTEDHYIRNITVMNDHVEMEYIPDWNTQIGEIALERSSNGSNFTILNSSVSIQQESPTGPYIIKDFSALTDRTALYYKVSIQDACANKYSTLPAKTIFLSGENLGVNNSISWDESIIDTDENLNYEVYRIIDNDTSFLTNSQNSGTYIDQNIYANNFFSDVCYFVMATHQTTDTARNDNNIYTSQSNTVCLSPTPQAFVPNAFAPYGTNKIFKPILVFGSDENYLIEIFNRYGQKVFESQDPNKGWNGQYKGEVGPMDSYTYHLQFTGLDGQSYRKTGFVVLVR